MLQIDLMNVQAIGEAHIEIEDNSIVEFVGDNSNGKSIVAKIIEALTKNDLKNEETRMSLIKDDTEHAIAIFTHNKEQLGIILKPEVKDSCLIYTPNVDEPNTRYIRCVSDREGCDVMIRKFGFRSYTNGDICLQLSPTFGSIPFITTGGATNFDIVQDITTDKVADEFLNAFKTITFPTLKERLNKLKAQRDSSQAVLDNMEVYDWRAYEKMAEELSQIYRELQYADLFHIDAVPIPDLSFVPTLDYSIKPIPIIEVYEFCPYIKDIGRPLQDYLSIYNGVCPTCKRRLFE